MPQPQLTRILFRSALATLAMFVGWLALNTMLPGSVWASMQVSKSALTAEYCEFNNTDRFFHQPMNTYSNLAYFFLGILVLQIAIRDFKTGGTRSTNRLQAFPLLSALTGICFIYLSLGSAFFHASLTYIGQRVDMNGTYGLTLSLVGIALYQVLYKINLSESGKRGWLAVLVVLILLFLKISLLIPSGLLLPILILSLLLLTGIQYIQFRKERFGWIALASFILIVIAIKIRTLDVQKFGCNPHSLVQGHAIWHLLTGLSSFCSYAFFRFRRSDS